MYIKICIKQLKKKQCPFLKKKNKPAILAAGVGFCRKLLTFCFYPALMRLPFAINKIQQCNDSQNQQGPDFFDISEPSSVFHSG